MTPYDLAKAVALLFAPPNGAFILLVLGLLLRRHRRLSMIAALSGIALYFLFALPVTTRWMVQAFDDSRQPTAAELAAAQAIVIPGAGLTQETSEFGVPMVNSLTLQRIRHGALLAREWHKPVLVTGGTLNPAFPTEASLIASVLKREYGIDVQWSESTSRNTRENAEMSFRILNAEGVRRIVLVVNKIEMPRASEAYRNVGFEVIPAPTGVPSDRAYPLGAWVFPSLAAMDRSALIYYEALGRMRDWLRDTAASNPAP